MKASDDLKLFCADPYTGWVPREKQQDELRKIAARVEEVEQRAEELEHALEDAHAGLVQWHDRAVMLPTDAEGVPFRVGDVVESSHYEGGTVAGIRYYETGGTLIAVRPHGWDTATWNDPGDYTHVTPDSWGRIIEDAQADGVRYHNEGKPSDFDALVERCKRLAGEDA